MVNFRGECLLLTKWSGAGSNRRHTDFQSVALPTELPDLTILLPIASEMASITMPCANGKGSMLRGAGKSVNSPFRRQWRNWGRSRCETGRFPLLAFRLAQQQPERRDERTKYYGTASCGQNNDRQWKGSQLVGKTGGGRLRLHRFSARYPDGLLRAAGHGRGSLRSLTRCIATLRSNIGKIGKTLGGIVPG